MNPNWKDVLFVAQLEHWQWQGAHLQFTLRMGSVDALSEKGCLKRRHDQIYREEQGLSLYVIVKMSCCEW